MALIAVLWIVAALSIMVTGLTATVRQQIQITGVQRDQTSGLALGEAAIALALQELAASRQRPLGIVSATVPYAGVEVEVEVAPLNGLISLNGASVDLLAALLQFAGELDAGQAQALAQTLVEWRDGLPQLDLTADAAARSAPRRFEAPEDLLLVPGVDYALYARIAPLVNADLNTGQVNPLAAPPAVQALLAAAGLQSPPAGGGTDVYRLQARVPLEAGKILLLTQDVALGAALAHTAPWRILRADRQILSPAA